MKSHLVVLIPAFNERQSISGVVKAVPKKIKGVGKISTVVIDDGSNDDTAKHVPREATVIRHLKNRGLGRSFNNGLRTAIKMKADIIVNIDGDGQFDAKQITKLVKPIIKNQAEVVIGSRFIKNHNYKTSFTKRYGNKSLALVVSIISGQRFYDVTCGFRAYSREAALNLNIFDKFSYTLESLVDLAYKNFKIKEIAVDVKMRRFGKSKIVSSVFYYTIKSFSILLRNTRDQKPFHFFVLPGLISLALSLSGFIFMLFRFIKYGVVSPYRSLLQVSITFLAVALFLYGLGLIFDYFNRMKKSQGDILYYLKKYDK